MRSRADCFALFPTSCSSPDNGRYVLAALSRWFASACTHLMVSSGGSRWWCLTRVRCISSTSAESRWSCPALALYYLGWQPIVHSVGPGSRAYRLIWQWWNEPFGVHLLSSCWKWASPSDGEVTARCWCVGCRWAAWLSSQIFLSVPSRHYLSVDCCKVSIMSSIAYSLWLLERHFLRWYFP